MLVKVKNSCKSYGKFIGISLIAIPMGVLIGTMETVFGTVLLQIGEIRNKYMLYILPFLSVVGVCIVYAYERFGKDSAKGMSLIFQVAQEEKQQIPLRLIPFSMIGTWLTHLFGGSAGREGVAVQTGGALSWWIGKQIGYPYPQKTFLIMGMAAGFAGLFQTPIGAILFAVEVLMVGVISYEALLPTLIIAFVSSETSHQLGLEKFTFLLTDTIVWDKIIFIKLLFLGIVFGVVGGGFAYLLQTTKKQCSQKIKHPIKRVFLLGCVLSVLLLFCHKGRYSGLGTNLIESSFYGGTVYFYDWVLKIVFTIFTLSIGFQGGEVTPLFSIGASLGVVLAPFIGLPIPFVAALGYISVFAGATNTFFAPIFIGGEVFGYENIPYFFIVCAISYLFNKNKSIYSLQRIYKDEKK